MSRCVRPSASCARSSPPSDQPGGWFETGRAAVWKTAARFLCSQPEDGRAVLSCPHESRGVYNVPHGVYNVCGEDGDCYPVLIHTRFIDRVSSCCPRSCLLYTSDAADERSSVDLGG